MAEEYRAFVFRDLMTKWDDYLSLEQEKKSIEDHLDQNQCILFFKKGNDLFGAPEESRLVFAKLKSEDEDMPSHWKDEARFIALNLINSILGQQTQNVFSFKDLDNLQLVDREKVINELMKKKGKKKKK
jgi:hypothetical protein